MATAVLTDKSLFSELDALIEVAEDETSRKIDKVQVVKPGNQPSLQDEDKLQRQYLVFIPSKYWGDIFKKEVHPTKGFVAAEKYGLKIEVTAKLTREDMDKTAEELFKSLTGALGTFASHIGVGDHITNLYKADIRLGLLEGFKQMKIKLSSLPETKTARSKVLIRELLYHSVAYMKHNFKRAVFEELALENLRSRKTALEQAKHTVDAGVLARLHLAEHHFGEAYGKNPYNVFVPAVDMANWKIQEYTPGNLLVYEIRRVINDRKRVWFGADGFGNGAFSYHWYEGLNSIDIYGGFQVEFSTSMKHKIPLYYFIGDERTQHPKVRDEKAVLEKIVMVAERRLTNDQSFFLLFRDQLNSYRGKNTAETAENFLTRRNGPRAIKMLLNSCKFYQTLSKYAQKNIEAGGELFAKEEHKELRNAVIDAGELFRSSLGKLLELYYKEYKVEKRKDSDFDEARRRIQEQYKKRINEVPNNDYIATCRQLLLRYSTNKAETEMIRRITYYEDMIAFEQWYNAKYKPKEIVVDGYYLFGVTFARHYFARSPEDRERYLVAARVLFRYIDRFGYWALQVQAGVLRSKMDKELLDLSSNHFNTKRLPSVDWITSYNSFLNLLTAAETMVHTSELANNEFVRDKFIEHHFPTMEFHYKCNVEPKKIIVTQMYSHMYEMNIDLLGKPYYITRGEEQPSNGYLLEENEDLVLGRLGSNGHATGPHIHITTTWQPGSGVGIDISPALFFRRMLG